MGIPILANEAQRQHASSRLVTQAHVESIIGQETQMRETGNDGRTSNELRRDCKKQREEEKKEFIERVDRDLPTNTIPFVNQARDKGASSWLNALPIEELKFVLNKEEFRDALRLRYNIDLDNLPTTCPCGKKFDVTHALSCGNGGFVIERHDNIKNTLTTLLTKVCLDVEAEPELIPITKETFINKTANTSDGARPDIKAKSFWQRGANRIF